MTEPRTVSLFRNGRNQAVRIPVDMELPGSEALIRKEGDKLIIEPKPASKKSFFDILDEFGPLEEPFPDVDEGLLPLREIDLE